MIKLSLSIAIIILSFVMVIAYQRAQLKHIEFQKNNAMDTVPRRRYFLWVSSCQNHFS
jgi:hypothetical protein